MAAFSFVADPVLVSVYKRLSIPERKQRLEEAEITYSGGVASTSTLGLSETVTPEQLRVIIASLLQADLELDAVADGGTADAAQGPLGHAMSFAGQYILGR
jgi:hypothetical protein